jgi:hypothetical protein
VRLRPFPYPYRAALAVCSDIDECDRSTFLAVHRYLNDPRRGLGLPVADSFFGHGREPGQMAYFLPGGITPGPDADLITRAIKGGLIDSLHAWGDYNHSGPEMDRVLRPMAARLTEDLLRRGLSVKIWLNHGDPCNRQNLQARLEPRYEGDDPSSPCYTGDLLKNLGLKYYWWSELVTWPLSGRRSWALPGSWMRPGVNALKNAAKTLLGQGSRIRSTAEVMELCRPTVLRDGLHLLAFTRHLRGLLEPTTRHTLRYTLDGPVLEQLLREEGYLILYTHLGMPRPKPGEDLFPAPDRAALELLARYYQEGRIWVAPTLAVLNHWLAARHLNWSVGREGEKLIIRVDTLNDPTTGPRPPVMEELAGLCFYVPPDREVILQLPDREIVPRVFGPDHTGEPVVGLPPPPPPSLEALEP